jgi:hypothetical protein
MKVVRRFATLTAAAGWLAVASAQQPIRVSVDVKPGDAPTTIKPGREGMIPVAVLSTPQFDAATIDPATIRIGPTGAEAAIFRSTLDDVDRDGDVDLMLLVRVQDLALTCAGKTVVLKARTASGQQVEGSEVVTLEGCPGGKP